MKGILDLQFEELEFLIMQDSFSNDKWFDILIKGNSKYDSILKISKIENIQNDNIICFGDGLNDIDMLKKTGVGVAMSNALEEVKNASNFVTLSNDEDGVIEFLKEYLK